MEILQIRIYTVGLLVNITKHAKRKLDIEKSCIRLKKTENIPYKLIGELCHKISVDQWIKIYESNIKK